jgi:hypothetical protein
VRGQAHCGQRQQRGWDAPGPGQLPLAAAAEPPAAPPARECELVNTNLHWGWLLWAHSVCQCSHRRVKTVAPTPAQLAIKGAQQVNTMPTRGQRSVNTRSTQGQHGVDARSTERQHTGAGHQGAVSLRCHARASGSGGCLTMAIGGAHAEHERVSSRRWHSRCCV